MEHIAYEARFINNITVYSVRVKPVNYSKVFRTGMTATITITTESKKNAMSIPNSFITEAARKK
ncbi:MAG: hypothetical protein LBS81_01240 [Endomicrobium sp.]|nr:hypothetical protein [Endomicrobium sp.]